MAAALEILLQDWRERLRAWSADGSLASAARHALELGADDPPLLSELVRQWTEGDFSALPPITLLPASSMPGAAGAYAISTGEIYLNEDWLETATDERVIAVLTEELGHHLDSLLNEQDTAGDEGALLSGLLHSRAFLFENSNLSTLDARDHIELQKGKYAAAELSSLPSYGVYIDAQSKIFVEGGEKADFTIEFDDVFTAIQKAQTRQFYWEVSGSGLDSSDLSSWTTRVTSDSVLIYQSFTENNLAGLITPSEERNRFSLRITYGFKDDGIAEGEERIIASVYTQG